MIKHRKIIICILLSYALFIVGIFNVKAEVISNYWNFSGFTDKDWYFNKYNQRMEAYSNFYNNLNWYSWDFPPNAKTFTFQFYINNTLGDGQGTLNCTQNSGNGYCLTYEYGKAIDIQVVYGGQLCYANLYNNTSNVTTIQFTCPINNIQRSGLWYALINTGNQIQFIDYGFSYHISFDIDSNTSIANSTNDINNKLSDSSIDTNNTSSSVDGFSSSTNGSMTNTPVSSMISLPITFLTGVNNALSNSCTNVNYIELFGYQLVLPCLNLSERLGSVWTIIDTIFSCMLIFSIGKSLVSTFARLSDMDTNIMYECYANGSKHRGESFDD